MANGRSEAALPGFQGELSGNVNVTAGRLAWDTPLALGTLVIVALLLLFLTQRGFPRP